MFSWIDKNADYCSLHHTGHKREHWEANQLPKCETLQDLLKALYLS